MFLSPRRPRGTPVRTGKEKMLALLETMPAGTWQQVSLNTYQSIWPSDDYRAPFNSGVSDPAATIRAWSSFAWDDENCELLLWGGGHANSASNALWRWRAIDRLWQLAFYDSGLNAGLYDTVGGALDAPMSSHTYANQVYLSVLRRFCTFGGAEQPGGTMMKVYDAEGNVLRFAHCYLADLAQAGTGKVGGATGTNVKRGSTSGLTLPGAVAWQLRDWVLLNAAGVENLGSRVNGWAAAVVEDGKDVVYLNTWPSGTSKGLVRIQFNDADDASLDVITVMGRPWNNVNTHHGGAYDPTRKLAVVPRDADYPLEGWNLNSPGPTNSNYRVPASAITGDGLTDLIAAYASGFAVGICFDERRSKFIVWAWGGAIFEVTPPANLATLETSGWVVEKIGSDALSPRPLNSGEYEPETALETGVHGKFKYSVALDCYIGLQHAQRGDIWLHKPLDWMESA